MQNQNTKKTDYGISILSWLAPEYKEVHRGPVWVMGAAVCALLLIVWAIWQDTYSFAVAVILLASIYFLTHHHKPKTVEVALTTRGIRAGKLFFPYADIQTFWILYKPESDVKTLNIVLKSGFVREYTFQLEDQDPNEVHSYLSNHVYELEGRTENIVEKLIRVLKL